MRGSLGRPGGTSPIRHLPDTSGHALPRAAGYSAGRRAWKSVASWNWCATERIRSSA